jgi:hypothetical protein
MEDLLADIIEQRADFPGEKIKAVRLDNGIELTFEAGRNISPAATAHQDYQYQSYSHP